MDAVILFDGFINGYFKWMVIDNIHIDGKKWSAFLVRRRVDIDHGMLTSKEAALPSIGRIPCENGTEKNQTMEQIISNRLMKILDS
ncbi:hypothetical protein KFZ56_16885 [Virgibacillus sp. NKC19-3]|uniref:hypothetical protein n=1 Tax=Virgibacillus saliphilus TaxID=2831674 RepID=UPI001C9A8D41|nr:hypothetical protein [Virgibacillus sp. NKC19-3]MBY7144697.1 hypothetical protein [Virgibacillus sp. NKC19-3]